MDDFPEKIRKFESGASRDNDKDKFDIESFENPLVNNRYYEYMHDHRKMKDGSLRDGDNWQGLFGEKHLDVCIKSLIRHIHDLRLHHRNYSDMTKENIENSLCAIIFNTKAYLFKLLLDKRNNKKGD